MASKVAEVEQPGVCSPLWLSVILASTPGPPNHRRRLQVNYVFTSKYRLRTAVREYENNAAAATTKYGPIADWDVSGIIEMNKLFYNMKEFNADINSWDTSSVSTMEGMFRVVRASSLV